MGREAAAIALSVGAGGVILLLLAGTEIFGWYWPPLMFVAALGIAVYRGRRNLRTRYQISQQVDRELKLADGLSTVYYFRHLHGSVPPAVDRVEAQIEPALHEEELRRAMPVRVPAAFPYAIALTLMAAGMVGVRYGVLHSLSLQKPVADLRWDRFDEPRVEAKAAKSAIEQRIEEQMQKLGISVEDLEAPIAKAQAPDQTSVSAMSDADGTGSVGPNEKGETSNSAKTPSDGGENEGSPEGSGNPSDSAPAPGEGESAGKEGKGKQAPEENPKGQGKNGGENSNLMNKMKDALANLMNKMKMQPPTTQAENQTSSAQSPSDNKGQQQASNQKGAQGQSRSQNEGEQSSMDQQAKAEGDGGEKMPGSQQQAGDKSSDRPAGQEAKSGMGKQDGAKDIKAAEQLEAMGKISEIFGKRAAQIQGEMTVEVPPGKQSLRTAYSDKKALHANLGGDSDRDTIPLVYQGYVQRYFEEVRKQAAREKARAQ